jgi:hypothetical protein
MLSDVVRVAESELNPYHKHRTVSKARYRELGHFPHEYLEAEFGTWARVTEAAGLTSHLVKRRARLARADADRRSEYQAYAAKHLMQHAGLSKRGAHLEKVTKGTQVAVVLNDVHSTCLDAFLFASFLQRCRDLEPDLIVINGDGFDFAAISRHTKVPWETPSMVVEQDFMRHFFRHLREACPDAEIVFITGNHDLDRWVSYLCTQSPAVADMPHNRIDHVMGIDLDLGVRLKFGGAFCSPIGTEEDEPRLWLWDRKFLFTHGTYTGPNGAKKELESWNTSGSSGHLHTFLMALKRNGRGELLEWRTNPAACNPICGRHYIKGSNTASFGWGEVYHCRGHVRQQTVILDDGIGMVDGNVWIRPDDYVQPDPTKNWLKDWKLPK